MTTSTVRCLLGMLGTDVHSKGIRTIAQFLRDAEIEVIYIGEHNSVAGMAQAALDEDADIVGLSFSSAAYIQYTRLLIEEMRRRGAGDVPVMVGGLIHPDDHAELKAIGVKGIFGPGTTMPEIIDFVQGRGRTSA
ncbi:cobalamin-binding protein [Sphingobium sp. 22B]|uniref:cobalamin B12-binding domain-containing protein n=1 Tax=unclassified Sphingobium TaxID=2611147 RepID=UPI0007863C90|nr:MULTISPECIES: cobalamin-dependent protein [unclassified Sphingobium]KXU33815.1 cobalamin-binding protein [Sphingobium sp. AM]KYC33760.1 cobalamin-binding protein [Sphingobium sp. 22B]